MRFALSVAMVLFSCVAPAAAQQPPEAREALFGFDPVILVEESREVLGDEAISLVRNNFWYLFANAENKRKFERNPERYEIQMGGLCARMGGLTPGDPDNFLVHDGRIYIFGSQRCRELFAEHAERYLEPEPPEIPRTHEAESKGRELVSKAVQWLGGPDRLDDLHSLAVTGYRQAGEDRAQVETVRVFDLQFRRLIKHPRYGEFGVILNDAEAYRFNRGGARPMSAAQRDSLYAELGRDLLALLRARRRKDFQVAWLGRSSSDPGVERVWVGLRDFGAVLEIESDSGAVRALSYQGRGEEGDFGEIRKSFADVREVSGLRLPFEVKATFDGEPFPDESLAVESVAVDEPVEPGLFRPPSSH